MRVFFSWYVLLIIISVLLLSCSAKTDDNTSGSSDNRKLGIGNTTDMGDDPGEMASLPSVNL